MLIVDALSKDDWLTIGELSEDTGLGPDSISQVTSALPELFEKFPCPEEKRGREVAIRLRVAIPALR